MDVQDDVVQLRAALQATQWRLSTRILFRFCLIYFTLFCLATRILGALLPIPTVDIPDLANLWPLRPITFWTASHVFHSRLPLVYTGSGSGDKTFDWVLSFCLVVFAVAVTCLWSALEAKREHYVMLHKWFRVFIRFALAGQMLSYGMAKAIPLQMRFPNLTRLLETFGNFSPMGVLWSSIGASPSYEMFTGCAEILGGILLIIPRTTTLGALVCLAESTLIFALNMTYDVPVKLFSFHLLLLSLLLLAPDSRRLLDFFLRNRPVPSSTQPPLFAACRANRIALVVQIVFGISLLGANAYSTWTEWHTYGGGRPKSPLYGIWNLDELFINGQLRSPLQTDYDRFRYVVFDAPKRIDFQRMDGSLASYDAAISTKDKTIALTKASDKQ
jgi:hypothetical protein